MRSSKMETRWFDWPFGSNGMQIGSAKAAAFTISVAMRYPPPLGEDD